jgi:Nif-specific regulatory protein
MAPADFGPVAAQLLELLARDHGARRAALLLLEEGDGAGARSGTLQLEAVVEPGGDREPPAAELPDELVRRVMVEARPLVAGLDQGRPALAAPLLDGSRAVGVLWAELAPQSAAGLDRTLQWLEVLAGLLAQALWIRRLLDLERAHLREENAHLRRELQERYDFPNLVGTSSAMREVYEQIAQVAVTDTTVLIRGESGTGKELIAHAIHYHSPRARGPFIKVNCAALPESLIESELFGHERGAFTGALARKRGRFERAHGGTVFLDEVGELSPATQVKLLRVLQERTLERVGGHETLTVDVRVIAATNADLETLMRQGRFREDLYYRLNVFPIFVPPLRDRKADIMLLADHFVQRFAAEQRKRVRRISTPAIDMLMSYHWPGNVRELENAIERAVVVCREGVIHAHHLPPSLQTAEATGTGADGSLGALVATFERDLIQDALKTTRGNRAAAARLLKTTERILGYKVRKYGIDPRRFRS